MVGLNIFHPSLPKCISLNWRENRVENERQNPNDFFTPVPCCLLNIAADMKREFEHWEAATQYC